MVTGPVELTGVGSAAVVVAGGSATELVASTPESALVATGSLALEVAIGSALALVLATTAATVLPLGAETDGSLASSALIQPVFAVRAAGQATCVKETVGLSAPSNQPKRQLQPS